MVEKKRILIVDDSKTFLQFIRELLTEAGAHVVLASDGKEGLEKHASGLNFDLVLLDLWLPDMNGIEVLKAIREKDDQCTIVMLTGAGNVKSALEAVRAGADGYTEKQDFAGEDALDAFWLALEHAMQFRAGVLAQKNLQEKLEHMSMHDGLTDVYNRAYFEEELSRLERSRRYPVTVLVLDLNWLKETNDEFGHAAGDDLLRRTAKLLTSTFRGEDTVARIGGDEFVVLLPETDAKAIPSIIGRIQNAMAADRTAHPDLPLSLALGAATAESRGTLPNAFERADKAMYEHKEQQKDT